jgi:hypothetical protein
MPRHRKEAGDATAPQKCKWCDEPGTKSLLWAEGMAYIPTCDKHEQRTRNKIEKGNNDEVVAVKQIKEAVYDEPAPFNADWVAPETKSCPWCLDQHPYEFDTNQCPTRLERLRNLYPPRDPSLPPLPPDEPAPFVSDEEWYSRQAAFDPQTYAQQGYQVQTPIHTMKVQTSQGTHHVRRCGECGTAYSHKATTKTCPTCGIAVYKGHHH